MQGLKMNADQILESEWHSQGTTQKELEGLSKNPNACFSLVFGLKTHLLLSAPKKMG